MKKVILVDGNNLLFRSYYATAYSGTIMRNSKGFPTNGLYGLVNMLNKIIKEEKPEYMIVAFDKGKTFRHDKYKEYKDGRSATPEELKMQFKVAKELVPLMGIKCFEIDNYEADDIIGTYSKLIEQDDNFIGTIVSSDKDLLQLISDQIDVKLLKQKDYIRMDKKTFEETYGIKPINMIDLKGLMGDSSDNIPGVKGIGEKTALKLLQEYTTVENVYENIDNIKGAVHHKLIDGKSSAFMSKDIATIYKDVPVEYSLNDLKYDGPKIDQLKEMYSELEFYSFLKNDDFSTNEEKTKIEYKKVSTIDEIKLNNEIAIYIEMDNTNYHDGNILGISAYDGNNLYYIDKELFLENKKFFEKFEKYTYDLKKNIVSLNKYGIKFDNCSFDAMIAGYILNYNVKDDIAYLANDFDYEMPLFDSFMKDKNKDEKALEQLICDKAVFIYEIRNRLIDNMKEEEQLQLFSDIEMKLSYVLADMEIEGVRVDTKVLDEMGDNINKKLEILTNEIYKYAGKEFNIQSPKQLGEVLFDDLQISYPKKKKTSYSTAREILDKIVGTHPIVEKIIDYRTLAKIYNTYIIGIKNTIKDDGKLHTIYTQTLTRTGRLSSIEPNLQNIPIRYKEGKDIRKAFVPEDNCVFLSSDYSQIELRVFAHMSGEKNLIDAFNNDLDIHTKTAMNIYHINADEVTSNMRRDAKAVNFGIIYGISPYGLAEDLHISLIEANEFLNKYYEAFPGIKDYREKVLQDARDKGYVKTIMNRKRKIDEINNSQYMIRIQGDRMALNTPVQGSAADILKIAMINIYNEFNKQKLKSKMILQIHDELIFNVLKEEEKKVKEIVIKYMENAYKLSVPLKVDVSIGNNLYEAK
ncbi:MAG: DNA polymerase I [Bacilli bacterium]|nr:DNA polymerase I [Bacilli bacterium]